MPTYNINMNAGDASQGWDNAASALAKALTPDYRGQADAALRGAQIDRAEAGANASFAQAGASRALQRQRVAEAIEAERRNSLLEAFTANNANVAPNVRAGDYANLLFNLGEVSAADFPEFNPAVQANAAIGDPDAPYHDPKVQDLLKLGAGGDFADTREGFQEAEANDIWSAANVANIGADSRMAVTEAGHAAERVTVIRDGTPVSIRADEMLPTDEAVLSETQVKGGVLRGLPQEEQERLVMAPAATKAGDLMRVWGTDPATGETALTTVNAANFDPDIHTEIQNSKPSNYMAIDPETGELANYLSYDGLRDMQTGKPLPDGAYQADLSDTPEGAGVDMREAQAKAAQQLGRMINSDRLMRTAVDNAGGEFPVPKWENFLQIISQNNLAASMATASIVSDKAKSWAAASLPFLSASLRSDTGAAAPLSEYPMYYLMFIPLPGDGPMTIQMKRANRAVMMDSMRAGLPRDEALMKTISTAGRETFDTLSGSEGGQKLIEMFGDVGAMMNKTAESLATDGNEASPGVLRGLATKYESEGGREDAAAGGTGTAKPRIVATPRPDGGWDFK